MRRLVLALAGFGCSGHPVPAALPPVAPTPVAVHVDAPPGPPPPLDRDLPRLAERTVALYRALGDALAGDDCEAATAKLGALTETFDDVVAANAKIVREGRRGDLRGALAARDPELSQLAKRVVGSPALATCTQDTAFGAALDRLVGGPPVSSLRSAPVHRGRT